MTTNITIDPEWKDLLDKKGKDQTIDGVGKIQLNGTRVIYGNGNSLLAYENGKWENFEREHSASMWCEAAHNQDSNSTLAIYKHILKMN